MPSGRGGRLWPKASSTSATCLPRNAGALVGHDLGDGGADPERRFEFALTFDRELVIDVAATLIARVSAARESLLTAAA